MPHVRRWIVAGHTKEDTPVKLMTNDDIPAGRVLISQDGGGFICRIAELVYEPGEGDEDAQVVVNPVDLEMAQAMWFEPRGRVQ